MNSMFSSFQNLGVCFAAVSLLFSFVVSSHAVLRHPGMTDAEALALGALPQFESKAYVSGCSAAMLNSEWAVSAAHCISLEDEQRVTMTYETNGVSTTVAGTAYRVQSGDGGYDDVMLIHLDTPITAAVAWVAPYDRFDEYEQLGWQVGQGTSGALGVNTTVDSQFRAMTQRIVSTGLGEASIIPQHIYYNYNNPNTASPSDYATRFEGGTGPGDSGGPLYVYSRGRYFNASVVSGPQDGSYRNGRLSTHGAAMLARSGLKFAYPQQLTPQAVWVAEDLEASAANLNTVTTWTDRLNGLTFSNVSDGGAGAPVFVASASPTGLASVRLDGDDALGLSLEENPFNSTTAMSIAIVVKSSGGNAGLETADFGTSGLLDASVAGSDLGWGLSMAANGRFGWSIEDIDGSVDALFRGDTGNGSAAEGDWHVVVATWDGSEIALDNAGDERNMKLFVDSLAQSKTTQAANHFNIGRAVSTLVLGKSQTNSVGGFQGEIAEIRLYTGELQIHEVDRLLTSLRERYVSGSLGVSFERPWSSKISIPAGQSLRTRGLLTGGGTSMVWELESGPAPVTFSNVTSPDTEITFEEVGTHVLRAVVTDGVSVGTTDLTVEVTVPGELPTTSSDVVAGNWISSDVGTVDVVGSHSEAAGVFTVNGSGQGVGVGEGQTYDEGRFVWKAVAGDFDWIARLDSLTDASGPTRAGLMVRGGPGATDAAAFVGFAPNGTAFVLGRRDGGWYAELSSDAGLGLSFPVYLKLERRGETVAAFVSSDGVTYSAIGSELTVALPGVARVGMFVTSGNETTTVAGQFSDLSLLQKSFASTTALSVLSAEQSGGAIDLDPSSSGTDEPWLSVALTNGSNVANVYETYVGHRQISRATLTEGGNYWASLSADDGNALTATSRVIETVYHTRYEFNTASDTEGWNGNNLSDFISDGSSLTGTASSDDPQINITGLSLDGILHTQVTVRMKATVAAPIQLFWGREGAGGFAGARSQLLDYTEIGAFQSLVFDLEGVDEWDGETITALRLDPLNGSVNGQSFEIDFVEISDGRAIRPAPAYRFDVGGDSEGWKFTKDIASTYVIGGALQGTTTGNDSVLTRSGVDFDADGVDSVLLRIRSSVSGVSEFFWGTTETPAFSAARKVSASYVGDGSYQVLRLPLAGNAEWEGTSLQNIRLDPSNQPGAVFAIDTILFSDGDGDKDGMPDTFELANNLNPLGSEDAMLDADGDGVNNFGEYIAGTDPTDGSDRFASTFVYTDGEAFELNFSGKSGRRYRLMRKLNLTDASWVQVDSLGALGSDQSVHLSDSSSFDQAFYMVEISYP
ncbi:trypsin-like serine protease [Coraliomargarita algicola]|uniref:Trypsin-like serine protease n=1 Tax=Coraliomargarita algicola TaxID=3092156 RepID=A0ABZ0RPT3_9BACT|nr:trypsin-like serine protease [Coraliomargarita sp. J2-16]WPJ97118.1 trypsin-like serine protease [Coraliomargarita sp. J2-16]